MRWFERQHNTRRLLLAIATVVSLGLVAYATIAGTPLYGENLLIALVGGGGITYGITRHLGRKDDGDI